MNLHCIDWTAFQKQSVFGKILMCALPVYVYAVLLPMHLITFPFHWVHEKTSEYF